jgi:hypothetical protein
LGLELKKNAHFGKHPLSQAKWVFFFCPFFAWDIPLPFLDEGDEAAETA